MGTLQKTAESQAEKQSRVRGRVQMESGEWRLQQLHRGAVEGFAEVDERATKGSPGGRTKARGQGVEEGKFQTRSSSCWLRSQHEANAWTLHWRKRENPGSLVYRILRFCSIYCISLILNPVQHDIADSAFSASFSTRTTDTAIEKGVPMLE